MAEKLTRRQALPPAASVFRGLQVEEALLPAEVSTLRRGGALMLAFLVLAATPLFFAGNAAGLIGDTPAALAKSGTSPAVEEEDWLGPGDDEADDITFLQTNNTSANNRETRGTTRDNDTTTRTRGGTNGTSALANSTRGTTKDNDTRTNTLNSATGGPTNTNQTD